MKMSTSQMKQLHKAFDKASDADFKTAMFSVVKRDKFLKLISSFDKSSLQKLVDMKPNAPFSKAVQSYIDGKIRESVNEKKVPKKGSPDYHQHKIAVDTVRNPMKALMGGPSAKEAEQTLLKKFGYSKKEVEKLKESVVNEGKYNFDHLFSPANNPKKDLNSWQKLRNSVSNMPDDKK